MRIGVPKEIKNNENRVSLDPINVGVLVNGGHEVLVEKNAGLGSNFPNEAYHEAGAQIIDSAKSVWEQADMIMKVKEPQESEYQYFRKGLILYTYIHLANEPELAKALVDHKVTAIAYETIEIDGKLPLLEPMSEVAGRMATQIGARFLEKINGGKGLLLSGVPGTKRGTVTVIGGGTVGANAARIAVGMGAKVNILNRSASRQRELDQLFGDSVQTLQSNSVNIAQTVKEADVVISGALDAGSKADKLVTVDMMEAMEDGSVIVDVSIDQGGVFEGFDTPTTHSDPIIKRHGILYYGVSNIPGSVPNTASSALAANTVSYGLKIADASNVLDIARADEGFALGINTHDGYITNEVIANDLGYEYKPLF